MNVVYAFLQPNKKHSVFKFGNKRRVLGRRHVEEMKRLLSLFRLSLLSEWGWCCCRGWGCFEADNCTETCEQQEGISPTSVKKENIRGSNEKPFSFISIFCVRTSSEVKPRGYYGRETFLNESSSSFSISGRSEYWESNRGRFFKMGRSFPASFSLFLYF